MEQLHHQPSKTFEGSRDSNGGADFDEDAFGGMYEYLKLTSFVDGGVEEGEEALCHMSVSS